MFDLGKRWISLPCSKCGYLQDAQIQDVTLEETVFCHNCKVSIQLKDNEASAHTATKKINQAIQDLKNIFKKF